MAVLLHEDVHETIAAMQQVADALHDSLRAVTTSIAIGREEIAPSRVLIAAVSGVVLGTRCAAVR